MSVLETLQQEIADEIAADGFFLNIPVLVESPGNPASDLERALGPSTVQGGKVGAAVMVTTPTADVSWSELAGPFFDDIPVSVLVSVNPLTNNDPAIGTGASALAICEEVCAAVHLFFPGSANGPVVAQRPTIVRIRKVRPDDSIIQYSCRFKTMGGLRRILPQVATPTTSLSSGQCALDCATPGAAMFYTLDGTAPSPRNGTLYSGPFAAAPGQTVKARAWLAGYLASALLTQTF